MKFWYHTVPFALLGIFSIVELGLIGDILETFPYHRGKVGYMLFVSVWTSISLLLHWTFPFLFAAVWAALTTLLWFIAAGYTTTDSCTVIAPGPEFGNKVRVCSRESDKWKAMTALGWINSIIMLVILGCIWYYVMKRKEVTWRHGIYGRSYYFKPKGQVHQGDAVVLKQTSFSGTSEAAYASTTTV